jgi:hypothetical protein
MNRVLILRLRCIASADTDLSKTCGTVRQEMLHLLASVVSIGARAAFGMPLLNHARENKARGARAWQ